MGDKNGMCTNTERQVHTHTHAHTPHQLVGFISGDTLAQHTYTLPKKGGKGYRQKVWELQGQQVTLLIEEILNGTRGRKCTHTHTLAGSDATLRSYGLWHSVGSHHMVGKYQVYLLLIGFFFFFTKSFRTWGISFSEVDEKINITPMSAW